MPSCYFQQYTGLYQGHIERYLKGSELYFGLIGYEALPDRTLKLDNVCKDKVADAAFETYLDSAYFSYMGDIQDLLQDHGFSLSQVWQAREKFAGTPGEISRKMQDEASPTFPPDVDISNPMDVDTESPNDAGPEKASARYVTKQEKVPDRDSGYISKQLPAEELAKVQNQTKQEAAKRKATEAQNIENLSKQLRNLAQTPMELYEPATIDEHVDMSLQAIQDREKDDKGQEVEDKSTGESWRFVNENLQSRKLQGRDVTRIATDDSRPACLRLNTYHSMPSHGSSQITQLKPNGFSNNMAVAVESSTDADLWAASPPLENRKPLAETVPEGLSTPEMNYLLEDAMSSGNPQLKTPLEFSTFGKDASGRQPVQRLRPFPYGTAGCSAGYATSGEIQSDSIDDSDKVGQILLKTEKELNETLQKSPSSRLRRDEDYYSLPSAPMSTPEPVAPRGTTTEDLVTKMKATGGLERCSSPMCAGKTTWQCKSCTFINSEQERVCRMCGKSRNTSADLLALQSGTPQCNKCTFINEAGATRCKACSALLKGCSTYC